MATSLLADVIESSEKGVDEEDNEERGGDEAVVVTIVGVIIKPHTRHIRQNDHSQRTWHDRRSCAESYNCDPTSSRHATSLLLKNHDESAMSTTSGRSLSIARVSAASIRSRTPPSSIGVTLLTRGLPTLRFLPFSTPLPSPPPSLPFLAKTRGRK